MKTLGRSGRVALLGLGVVLSVACSFSADGIKFTPDEEFFAGSAGKGSAGTGAGVAGKGSAGAHTAGASGAETDAGANSGGDAGEGDSGGVAGSGVAGRGGSGGTGGVIVGGGSGGVLIVAGSGGAPVGGSGGAPPNTTPHPCKGETPGSKTLADFTGIKYLEQEWKDEKSTVFAVYGFPDPANSKPTVKLGSDNLVVESYGTNGPTGAGIRISPCIDFTGMKGIGFTFSAESKYPAKLVMRLITNQNLPIDDMNRVGTCLVPPGKDPKDFCRPSHLEIILPMVSTQLAYKFSDFVGGLPSDIPALDQVKGIEWALFWASDSKVYDATFSIDDVVIF